MTREQRALAAFVTWGAALAEARRLRALRDGYRCEDFEPDNYELGYRGTPHCYHADPTCPRSEWCASCQAREPIHEQWREAHRMELAARERARYYAVKIARSAVPEREGGGR